MPNNLLTADVGFPARDPGQSSQQQIDGMRDYLYMLLEQLRYTMGNLGMGNFNGAELDALGKTITEPVYLRLEDAEGRYTQLSVTVEGLSSRVQGLDGRYSSIKQTVDGISGTVSGLGGRVTTVEQTANGLTSTVNGLDGKYTALKQTVDGVTIEDRDGSTRINGSSIYTKNLYVDAANITGTLTASALEGETVSLLDYRGRTQGTLTIQDSTVNGADAIQLLSRGPMAMIARSGDLFLQSTDGRVMLDAQTDISLKGDTLPSRDNYFWLGSADLRWSDIYAVNSTINTSDRSQKTDISYDLGRYGPLFDRLKPCTYRFIDGKRLHTGLIAQDVETAMLETGVSDMELACYVRSPAIGPGATYGLRYGELIALLVDQVQKLKGRVAALEGGAV